MATYAILRFYQNHSTEIIATGLTEEDVRAHCSSPESASRTCQGHEGKERTRLKGPWFDGWRKENNDADDDTPAKEAKSATAGEREQET